MSTLKILEGEAIYYEFAAPTYIPKTFVFVNALTGNTGMWADHICEHLQSQGYGTLCYNFRGQPDTTFSDETNLSPSLIVDDLCFLLSEINPPSPILVGLSIGGLFASRAYLAGLEASGLVLINTLRKPSQRLDWINQAMVRLAKIGGGRLVMAANMPVIAAPDLLAQMWDATFSMEPYEAPKVTDGLLRLMVSSLNADWNLPYEQLDLPVLVLTGIHDRLFRIDSDISELKARIPQAEEKVYLDAGHLIPLERPSQFCEHLIEFATNC
ncbi:MAG: hypothetical protein CMF69_02650 [Magnetovibrio sp.]|nr:hypothetical protein [Magnetovibrio sp.]